MSVLRWCAAAIAACCMLVSGAPAAAQTQPDPSTPAPATVTPEQAAEALGTPFPRAAIIFDAATSRVLYGYHAQEKLRPASLLKMVTALLVAEHLRPKDGVKISARAAGAPHDRLQWRLNARFAAEDVLHGMMLESSNGAAIALAERIAGSVEAFATLATTKLRQLGATSTTFVDPSGLDAPKQVSTALDLARVARAVVADPWLARVVKAKSYRVPWPGGGTAVFRNTNRFMLRYDGAVGVKNGYTQLAGNTVVGAATRGRRTLIVVVLDGPAVYDSAARLADLGFSLLGIAAPVAVATPSPAASPGVDATNASAARQVEPVRTEPVRTTTVPVASHDRGGPVRTTLVLVAIAWLAALLIEDRRRQTRRMRAPRPDVRRATLEMPSPVAMPASPPADASAHAARSSAR